jgi:hypothetical protein
MTSRFSIPRRPGGFRFAQSKASALVVSLIFLVLITIAIVGFVTTAGLERKTVQSHFAGVQADLYSLMAVKVVASRITEATSRPNTWWVSQPGRIAYTSTGVNSPVTTLVDLSSGTSASVQADLSVNLNPASLVRGGGLVVSDTSVHLPVKWIYVRKDGTQEIQPTAVPAYSVSNPLVGRYAYWTDDESARLNVNTAVSGTAAFGEGDPDLTTLSTDSGFLSHDDVQKLKNLRLTEKRRFESVEELKAAGGASHIAEAVERNKDSLTHYSHSPGLNRFGEPRIVLTTQEKQAGGMPFLDILETPNSDPGVESNLKKEKIEALFARLLPYFEKPATAWGISYVGSNPVAYPPATYGALTLRQKYSTDINKGRKFAAQIILNIIEYVRSVETSKAMVLPIRGAFPSYQAPTTFTFKDPLVNGPNGSYQANGILGNSRRPHIVEMGVWLPDEPVISGGNAVYSGTVKARIYWPANSGTSINLVTSNLELFRTVHASSGTFSQAAPNAFTITGTNVDAAENPVPPGGYCTITGPVVINVTGTARPKNALLRMGLIDRGANLGFDLVPVYDAAVGKAEYVISGTGVPIERMNSISTNDPVVSQNLYDWVLNTGTNRFGTQLRTLTSTLGNPVPLSVPQQDADAEGNLTEVGTLPPPVKGSAGNPFGVVRSVGELGRVHTGGAGTTLAGVSWRTLRLQPRVAPQASLPDWLLLDLFTVPFRSDSDKSKNEVKADLDVLRPQTDAGTWIEENEEKSCFTAQGGRLNLNALPYPFENSLVRSASLKAILKGLKPSLSEEELNSKSANIINHVVASGLPLTSQGLLFGPTNFTAARLYSMPGEVSEISGLANGEEEEPLVQGLFGYLTTRSNVFSVFSVGQKIQQFQNGQIKVLGEARTRTLLERVNGKVQIRATTKLGE